VAVAVEPRVVDLLRLAGMMSLSVKAKLMICLLRPRFSDVKGDLLGTGFAAGPALG